MKRQRILGNERGFTLVEIIAVLILLGILAAVAVPKYIDLQDEARKSAGQAAIAEMKGRASVAFGKLLLANKGDTDKVTIASIKAEMGTDVGDDFEVEVTGDASPITITVNKVQGTAVSGVSGTWKMP